MATTITERVLNNTEAEEWLAQNMYAITGGDLDEVLEEIRSGSLTVQELMDGLNGVFEESMPVTVEQFEWWVERDPQYVR